MSNGLGHGSHGLAHGLRWLCLYYYYTMLNLDIVKSELCNMLVDIFIPQGLALIYTVDSFNLRDS